MSEDTRRYLTTDTLVSIQHALSLTRWSRYKKRSGQAGRPTELKFKKGDTIIPLDSRVDCLFMLLSGTVRMVAGPTQSHVPLFSEFNTNPQMLPDELVRAEPGKSPVSNRKNLPIVGARAFFTRRPSSYAYVAMTNAVLFTIESDLIVDIGAKAQSRSDDDMLLLMREVLINSDIAEMRLPSLLRRLIIFHSPIKSDYELLLAADEIRDFPVGKMLIEAIAAEFEELLDLRIEQAEVQGIESSIYVEQSQ